MAGRPRLLAEHAELPSVLDRQRGLSRAHEVHVLVDEVPGGRRGEEQVGHGSLSATIEMARVSIPGAPIAPPWHGSGRTLDGWDPRRRWRGPGNGCRCRAEDPGARPGYQKRALRPESGAERSGREQALGLAVSVVEALVEADLEVDGGGPHGGGNVAGLGRRIRDGLVDEHVLAGGGGVLDDGGLALGAAGHEDGVNRAVLEQVAVIRIPAGDTEALGELTERLLAAPAHGHDGDLRHLGQRGQVLLLDDGTCTDDTQSKGRHDDLLYGEMGFPRVRRPQSGPAGRAAAPGLSARPRGCGRTPRGSREAR